MKISFGCLILFSSLASATEITLPTPLDANNFKPSRVEDAEIVDPDPRFSMRNGDVYYRFAGESTIVFGGWGQVATFGYSCPTLGLTVVNLYGHKDKTKHGHWAPIGGSTRVGIETRFTLGCDKVGGEIIYSPPLIDAKNKIYYLLLCSKPTQDVFPIKECIARM